MLAPALAMAQAAPQVAPPSREQIKPQINAPVRPRVRIDSTKVEPAPCNLSGDIRANLTSVRFEHINGEGLALDPGIAAALQGITLRQTGDQPVTEVCYIRDLANARLKAAGYIASAQILAQDLSEGVLRLKIVTAHLDKKDVRIHGDAGPYRKLLEERIDQLSALNPLNEFAAEKILLLAGDVPGLDISLSLRSAGTTPGALIGDLTIAARPYRVVANINNTGANITGPVSAFVRAEFYGLTGHRDMTYVGFSSTSDFREQKLFQVGHSFGLSKRGDTLGANLTYAETRPSIENLDLRTSSTIGNIEYYLPIKRRVMHNLRLFTGLDMVEQKTRVFSGNVGTTITLDKLVVAYGRLDADWRFANQGSALRTMLELRQGLDVGGVTRKGANKNGATGSHFDGDSVATILRGEVNGTLGLGRIFALDGTLKGQWADKPLLSFEEFSVGALSIGRGYDPGAVSADRAVALRAELRAQALATAKYRVEPFGFLDTVKIWNLDPGSTETNRTLTSYGAGVRVMRPGYWAAELVYAHPKDKALSFDKAPPSDRLTLSLTLQFNPNPK